MMMKKIRRDTDQTIVPYFTQHGRMESRIEGSILINEATGPFNAEIIYAIQDIQLDLLELLNAKEQWAQIYIFHDSALCSPDTIDAMRAYMKKMQGTIKKPVGTAYVMAKTLEGRPIMAPLYRQVYEQAQLNFQLFFTVQEAQDWVNQLMGQGNNGL